MRSTNNIQIRQAAAVAAPLPPWVGLALLGVVYLVWGSTYLGIRVAVRGDGGFPPFVLGAIRLSTAGVILLAVAAMAGRPVRVRGSELRMHAVSGLLLWVVGNGLVIWALQRVDSGYAALLMCLTPVFVVLFEAGAAGRAPRGALRRAPALGSAGIALLSVPPRASAGTLSRAPIR